MIAATRDLESKEGIEMRKEQRAKSETFEGACSAWAEINGRKRSITMRRWMVELI